MNPHNDYWLLVFILCLLNGFIAYDIIWTIRTKRHWGKAIAIVLGLILGFGIVYYTL